MAALAVMVGCSEEPMSVQSVEPQSVEANIQAEGMMRLGPQLANPYALGNMQSLSNRSCFWIHAIADREFY